jgi:hypothetical protein
MAKTSVYELKCECGHLLISPQPELSCPECKRLIRIEWRSLLPLNPLTEHVAPMRLSMAVSTKNL